MYLGALLNRPKLTFIGWSLLAKYLTSIIPYTSAYGFYGPLKLFFI